MSIYLDHAATTALDPRVLEAMMPFLQGDFGNASSVHRLGQTATHAIDRARSLVAARLGCADSEVYFTSGGSESDNWALAGVMRAQDKRRRLVTTAIEHHAILRTCQALAKEGYDVVYVPVLPSGVVDMEVMQNAIDDNTALVSVMHANNETGILQPIAEIAALAHQKGALMHTDAVQTAGVYSALASSLDVDLLSLSAHKFYGPKGVGALVVRKGVRIQPLLWGGAQERGLRAGTYNTPAVVGLACALDLAMQEAPQNNEYVAFLRDEFLRKIEELPLCLVGEGERLPAFANVRFATDRGVGLLYALDQAGVCASAGSACTAGSLVPSHVLLAMGYSPQQALGAVRFTFGKDNTMAQVEETVRILHEILAKQS